jgi:predicted DNA-binding transcriptional regulator YafY
MEGYLLPQVNFNLHEAMALLLSARLMLRYADRQNQFTVAALEKLAAVLPDPLKAPLLETVKALVERPVDASYTKALATLTSAWVERRKVVITYTMERTFERKVWPLFLEPGAAGHTCYLVAYDQKLGAVRNYRVERISEVRLTEERFDPPLGFSITEHLANAWAIWSSAEPVQVELVFDASVARRVRETRWHPSQTLETLPDGRVRLVLKVASTLELKSWILGWGRDCEVVAPAQLRQEIAADARAMLRGYEKSQALTAFRELVAGADSLPSVTRRRTSASRKQSEKAVG